MLPVSLDCPFLIAPSVFPNVYILRSCIFWWRKLEIYKKTTYSKATNKLYNTKMSHVHLSTDGYLTLPDEFWNSNLYLFIIIYQKFEDTKGTIRIHKWKKDRQHNDQKKKDKVTNLMICHEWEKFVCCFIVCGFLIINQIFDTSGWKWVRTWKGNLYLFIIMTITIVWLFEKLIFEKSGFIWHGINDKIDRT